MQKQHLNQVQTSSNTETINGLIERITFHNPDNGFCVLKVKVRRLKDLVAIVGHASLISAGEHITATGIWINDKTHGSQFKANFIKSSTPTSIEGIEKYLGSGLIKGIGPVYAKKLVSQFKEDVFDIIEQYPERLLEVEGIGSMRSSMITKGWAEQKVVREIMLFLHQHKVSTARAVRIYKTYGQEAIKVISENPYKLARDIRGIGFITADQIAANLGIEPNSIVRARAGIEHILLEAMDEGNIGIPKEVLLKRTIEALKVDHTIIEEALGLEVADGTIILDYIKLEESSNTSDNTDNTTEPHTQSIEAVFLAGLYHTEKFIASRLLGLAQQSQIDIPWPMIESDKAITWVEEKLNIQLAESQKEAVKLALQSKILVITGGPGVGKTTLMSSILNILLAKKVKVLLCAPTGRAVKRLSESTKLEAKTIHRLLEVSPVNGEYKYNQQNPLDCDLLIIDETSMVDVPLMSAILKALPEKSALILVGDVDQLPSVGPGQVLKDIIDSNVIPTVRLTEVFRQAKTSSIITNAHKINKGMMPDLKAPDKDTVSDFYFIQCKDLEDGMSKIIELTKQRIPRKFKLDPIEDIQILCPMNRGYLGAHSINTELQKVLNPNKEPKVERFGRSYLIGDKVMQIQNDYDKEVFNGDIGYVQSIDLEASEIVIRFDERNITYDFGELDQIVPAYAITVHKSQGSEYPAVIIPLVMQHYTMLQKNLVYTAITRGKKLVIIVGDKKALAIAIKKRNAQGQRLGKLKDWLTA